MCLDIMHFIVIREVSGDAGDEAECVIVIHKFFLTLCCFGLCLLHHCTQCSVELEDCRCSYLLGVDESKLAPQ